MTQKISQARQVDVDANLDLGEYSLITRRIVSDDDLTLETGEDKTMVLERPTWEDIRITPGNFDRPGQSDPTIREFQPDASGTTTYLYEFAKNNIASFTVQIPHNYKAGTDIYAHVHWTPGARGTAESGNFVGWKLDVTWASIGSTFPAMQVVDLSDECDGTNWKHQMTPDIAIDGTGKGISSMLLCNIKRTDTGDDDTWASTTNSQQPILLEIDFHYQIDTMGSRQRVVK
jgi:hypothetical protein